VQERLGRLGRPGQVAPMQPGRLGRPGQPGQVAPMQPGQLGLLAPAQERRETFGNRPKQSGGVGQRSGDSQTKTARSPWWLGERKRLRL